MPSGSCICNKVAYEYSVEPALTALCHCLDCQKWGGSSFSSNVAIPTKDFHITRGTPKSYVRKGLSGLNHELFFCGDCGTSLFSRQEKMDGVTLIKSGTLDGGASKIPIAAELYNKFRQPYDTPVKGAMEKLLDTDGPDGDGVSA